MNIVMRQLFLLSGLIVFTGCSGIGSAHIFAGPSLSAVDGTMTLQQNSSATLDLPAVSGATIKITRQPAHGWVKFKNNSFIYRATNPLYNGQDSFRYQIVSETVTSNEATVSVTISPLASGATTFTENYASQKFSLMGWKTFSSMSGHSVNSLTEFRTATFNSVLGDSRHFAMYGDIAAYAGDSVYDSGFGVLPVDGAGGAMHDWPWKADVRHIPECGVDATVTMKVVPNNGHYPMVAILMNYDIDFDSVLNHHTLNGYQVLVNGGGGSLTLSRFENAHELATAYMDRWPNTNHGNEAMVNPVEHGPYKGWNYRNGAWPAGGNVGTGGQIFVAARYQYDVGNGNTTISYEARPISGVDMTPGSWDEVVTLSGADSLPTGGGFGLMALNYHTSTQILDTDFDVVEYKVECVLP